MTSKLDAINTILTRSQLQPVSSLDSFNTDVSNAKIILDEIDKSVQSRGWYFNTEKDVLYTPDVSTGEISIGSNVIRADNRADKTNLDVIVRGTRLYDISNRTYVFDSSIKLQVVYKLPFEETPEEYRRYVALKAAREFYIRFTGETETVQLLLVEERRAETDLKNRQHRQAGSNLLNNPSINWVLRGRDRWRW